MVSTSILPQFFFVELPDGFLIEALEVAIFFELSLHYTADMIQEV